MVKVICFCFHELTHPFVAFIVLLAVADENVVGIAFNNAWHLGDIYFTIKITLS